MRSAAPTANCWEDGQRGVGRAFHPLATYRGSHPCPPSPSRRTQPDPSHAEHDIRRVCLALRADQVVDKVIELDGFFDFCRNEVPAVMERPAT